MKPRSLILPGKEAEFDYRSKALAAATYLQQKAADKAKAAFRRMTPDQCRRFIRDADRITAETRERESVARSVPFTMEDLDDIGREARKALDGDPPWHPNDNLLEHPYFP